MESMLPFTAEYAATGKGKCKKCKQKIAKDSLRIAVMVQAHTFDDSLPLWHHWNCFFTIKNQLQSISQIANFDNLRFADQERMKNHLLESGVSVEYAKSSRSVCGFCQQKIKKDEVCVSKIDNDPRIRHNKSPTWHHVDCFVQRNKKMRFFDSVDKLPGYNSLKIADREMLEKKIGQKIADDKITFETKAEKPVDEQKKILEEQNREFFDMRDRIEGILSKKQIKDLLDYNNQYVPNKGTKLLDQLADCLVFGALESCPDCKSESLSFMNNKYICSGNLNEWTKCPFETEFPERKEFKMLECYQYGFTDYKPVVKKRLLSTTGATLSIKKNISLEKSEIVSRVAFNVQSSEDKVQKQLRELCAQQTLYKKVDSCTTSPVKKDEISSEDLPEKVKVTVKGAAAVDAESGLQQSCQVYQKGGEVYSAVLAYVDASKGKNSFYKLQILKSHSGSSYYLFRQWGRVGTKIGGKKIEIFENVEKAKQTFENLYFKQTENHWKNRHNFQKKPGCKYPLEVDYGQDNQMVKQKLKPGENSRLPVQVQELVCLIFDEDAMTNTMLEYEIDLKKMPLGKISEKQIALAYKVLGEAQQILARGGSKSKITEVSNRFFTLIPHNFGLKSPPLLEDKKIIKSKMEMLDSMLQMEIAYKIIKEHSDDKDPIDMHYGSLKADIEVLEKDTEEYLLIENYLKNTHAPTHSQYVLDLIEAFRVNRYGEMENYSKFKKLHNKKLLWHGSRLTNFVGILSQGLRIAPPEAPSTGYMFGKGVYFADMASKSANYSRMADSIGLLLLCEVALGTMYETTRGEYIKNLPDGKHSTLGLGMTIPNPAEKTYIGDVEVPYGRPVKRTDFSRSHLQYNEYIVYDTNQINIKYLLKVHFRLSMRNTESN